MKCYNYSDIINTYLYEKVNYERFQAKNARFT